MTSRGKAPTVAQESHNHQRAGALQPVLLSVFASLGVQPNSCVYVSTPITTGSRYLHWRESLAAEAVSDTDAYERGREQVKIENLHAAQSLVAQVRSRYTPTLVVDPTALLDVSGWEQRDYHSYWVDVISEYVHTVVFADGWQFSEGCAVEFKAAIELGLDAFDQDHRPLTPVTGLELLQDAIDQYSAAEVESQRLQNIAVWLQEHGCSYRRARAWMPV